jgi:7,8-dihydropterin-6-yl-methyl-4-(beta-D-ribofuranosyl)aminobenzene 5'-phosphate synthase
MKNKIKIQVLFDNNSVSSEVSVGWGLSLLVDNNLLFDTGEKANYLLHNMKVMKIDQSRLNKIVISHDHWDHTGGLGQILETKKGLDVYCCPGFSRELKQQIKQAKGKLVELMDLTEIQKNIFSTGQISGIYKGAEIAEQSLVLKTDNGLTVIAGCAHPGIIYILRRIKDFFPAEKIYAVLGGFHLMNIDEHVLKIIADKFRQLEVLKLAPMHCSGQLAKDIFNKEYGEDLIDLKAGMEIEV